MHPKDPPDKKLVPHDAEVPATPEARTPQAPPEGSPLGDYVRELQQEFEDQEDQSTLRP